MWKISLQNLVFQNDSIPQGQLKTPTYLELLQEQLIALFSLIDYQNFLQILYENFTTMKSKAIKTSFRSEKKLTTTYTKTILGFSISWGQMVAFYALML